MCCFSLFVASLNGVFFRRIGKVGVSVLFFGAHGEVSFCFLGKQGRYSYGWGCDTANPKGNHPFLGSTIGPPFGEDDATPKLAGFFEDVPRMV